MREIIFDTETTGLKANDGDRLVEIGCIEVYNRFPTGQVFHTYLNPQRDMPEEAFAVHGLSIDFLKDKPLFSAIAEDLIAFIGEGCPLVAHNASFDIGFINAEFARVGKPPIPMDRVVDTVLIARRKFPNQRNSLDALCERLGIDNSRRTKHGALLDAEILADVYVELMGGRQSALALDPAQMRAAASRGAKAGPARQRPEPLPSRLTDAERDAHAAFIAELGPNAIWSRYGGGVG
jgi:DNA polymerase III subunit epsilon